MPFPTYARLHHRSEGPSAKLKDCKCVTGAAATVADGVVACEVGADTIYWAGTDDALLL